MALLARVKQVHKADIATAQLSHASGGTATRMNPPIMLNSNLLRIMEHLRELRGDEHDLPRNKLPPLNGQLLFEHSRLDLNARSIRLVRILPDPSFDGHIQLEIRHASIDSAYDCLSYVWGEEKTLRCIRLGGRLFHVHQNLHAFLGSARKKPHICTKWLWIDALCIDQSNNSERSHQVQQMGHIFSRAVKVISWLGDDERIAQFLRESYQPVRMDVVYSATSRLGCAEFFESKYWTRAWITQEVGLARLITFMAANEEADRWQPLEEKASDAMGYTNSVYVEHYSHPWRGRSLTYIVQIFLYKECRDRRDRIYSLLALCGEGSDLEVDYDISYHDLAKQVLKACRNSFCLCAIRLLDRVLHLAEPDPAGIDKQSFGTLSLSTARRYASGKMGLTSSNKEIGNGDPMALHINLQSLCPLYFGNVYVTILPGTCYRTKDTANGSIMYHNECDIQLGKPIYELGKTRDMVPQSTHGCSVSYSRDAQTWEIAFPFAILLEIARSFSSVLCTRGNGAEAGSVEAHEEPVLRMSSGSDPHRDAPNLKLPIAGKVPQQSLQDLRSFEVWPHIDDDGRFRYCGVFVYDRKDNKKASQRLSSMVSDNMNASPRSSCMESSRDNNFPRDSLVSSISRLLQESQEVEVGHVS
jgi:hypothetical protein